MESSENRNKMITELKAASADEMNIDKIYSIVENYYNEAIVFKVNSKNNKNELMIVVVDERNKIKKVSEKTLRSKIKEELKSLKYNYSYKGTKYLEETIYLLYKKGYEKDNLSKDIYPIIAEKYNSKIQTVKCDIIQASAISYCECEQEKMEEYFGLELTSKPKTKDIIFAVMRNLGIL